MSRLGLEPRTPALKGQCSTIELPARNLSSNYNTAADEVNHKKAVATALEILP
jgi:hypothetical protein